MRGEAHGGAGIAAEAAEQRMAALTDVIAQLTKDLRDERGALQQRAEQAEALAAERLKELARLAAASQQPQEAGGAARDAHTAEEVSWKAAGQTVVAPAQAVAQPEREFGDERAAPQQSAVQQGQEGQDFSLATPAQAPAGAAPSSGAENSSADDGDGSGTELTAAASAARGGEDPNLQEVQGQQELSVATRAQAPRCAGPSSSTENSPADDEEGSAVAATALGIGRGSWRYWGVAVLAVLGVLAVGAGVRLSRRRGRRREPVHIARAGPKLVAAIVWLGTRTTAASSHPDASLLNALRSHRLAWALSRWHAGIGRRGPHLAILRCSVQRWRR